MKTFQGALPILLLAGALCSAHSSPVCSNECQSTIIKLQQRVVELQRLLSKCESTFFLNPQRSPLAASHSRLSTMARIGADMEEHLRGLASRRLLQSPAGRTFHTSRRKGLADVPTDYSPAAAPEQRRTREGEAVVRLGLLLAMTTSAKYVAGAATLAIAAINADPSLMQGRRLEYIHADSGCNAIQGVTAMRELLEAAKPVHGVIGAGCSSACESTGFLTAERGLPQVGAVLFRQRPCRVRSHVPAAWPPV